MEKIIRAAIIIREDENCRVSFQILTTADGKQIGFGKNLSIAKACQEIGAALYETENENCAYSEFPKVEKESK
jgi:hypothetical protein